MTTECVGSRLGSTQRSQADGFSLPKQSGTLWLAVLLACCACSAEDGLTESGGSVAEPLTQEAVIAGLQRAGAWEVAPSTARFSTEEDSVGDNALALQGGDNPAELARAEDAIWQADDGERYEALFITPDGTVYGRRGPAPQAETPSEANGWGVPATVADQADPIGKTSEPLLIGPNSTNDRRGRVSTGLTSAPVRLTGAMSSHGDLQSGTCSGTKIGPRVVLTASHCVWNGQFLTQSGFWNPGQSNTTTPNGSFAWTGVALRDHIQGDQFDYAVIFLPDTQAVFNLSWMGAIWGTAASWYANKSSHNNGYPCGPDNVCGTIAMQTCKASPLANKQCDGWMYSDPSTLVSGDFLANDLLSFDNDISLGHSGSAVYTSVTGGHAVMAVAAHATLTQKGWGPRFRQSMWNDVCSWLALPGAQSSFGQHPLCH